MEFVIIFAIVIFQIAVFVAMTVAFIKVCYRNVIPGQALVIMGLSRSRVTFTSGWVLPMVTTGHTLDCTMTTIGVAYDAERPLRTADRADVQVGMNFNVHIPANEADVLQVLKIYSANYAEAMERVLRPHFRRAVEKVAAGRTVKAVYDDQLGFADAVEAAVPQDLDGFALHSVSLERLWPTPLDDAPA